MFASKMALYAAVGAIVAVAHAQAQGSGGGVVRGTVFDSLSRRPLAGAAVSLVASSEPLGVVKSAVSDAAGRYEIREVPSGTYLIGFLHPLLDSIGLEAPTRRVVVSSSDRGAAIQMDLAVPSPRTIRDAICKASLSPSDSSGVLIGHLSNATSGEPVDSGKVTAQWSMIAVTDGHLVRSIPTVRVTPGPEGWFAFCKLPSGTPIMLQATNSTDSSGVVAIDVAPFGVTRRDLFVGKTEIVTVSTTDFAPGPDSSRVSERVHRGKGRLSGIVRDAESGKPLSGAQLSVEGSGLTTQTNADGAFVLSGLPLGTQSLVTRKVGYVPDEHVVNLLADETARAEPTLTTVKNMLDTVRVRGTRVFDADRNGFQHRKKFGLGHFFDEADVNALHPIETSDLFSRIPSVRVDQARFDKVVTMRGAKGGRCIPNLYIDGMPYRRFSASDLDNMLHPGDLAGVEVYTSPVEAPAEFGSASATCGTILIWTKR